MVNNIGKGMFEYIGIVLGICAVGSLLADSKIAIVVYTVLIAVFLAFIALINTKISKIYGWPVFVALIIMGLMSYGEIWGLSRDYSWGLILIPIVVLPGLIFVRKFSIKI